MNRTYFLTLLRCHADGNSHILYNPSTGEYLDYQRKSFDDEKFKLNSGELEERLIAEQLQLELYGEFPLSDKNQLHWDVRIKHVFFH